VTRVFLFDDDDLVEHISEVARVLIEQSTIGVAWAVVPFEELDPVPLGGAGALDFAIFNQGAAVSFFRDYRELTRKFRAAFARKRTHPLLLISAMIHNRLVRHCWLATTAFRGCLSGLTYRGKAAHGC
jgi:hypothetical protein